MARLAHELSGFRAAHPVRWVRATDGVCAWPYLASGPCGAPAVLLLPGALGQPETAFPYIAALEQQFRVYAPGYPAAFTTLDQLAGGAAGVLEACGLARAHVVGGSLGGMVAQRLLARHPARVAGLVLCDTTAPWPRRALLGRALALLAARLPRRVTHAFLIRLVDHYVREIEPSEVRIFWRAHFHETIATLTPAEIAGRVRAFCDFDASGEVASASLRRDVLLIHAAGDRFVGPRERARLRARFPCAALHTIQGSGHAASIARADEYITTITAFLDALSS